MFSASLGRRLRLLPALAVTVALVSGSVGLTGPLPGLGTATPHPVKTSRTTTTLEPVPWGATASAPEPTGRTGPVSPTGPREVGPEGATIRSAAIIPAQDVPGSLAVVGAVWDAGVVQEEDVIEIRVRRAGDWGPWQEMEVELDHGPDNDGPAATEGRGARLGTGPYVVDGEQTQVRLLSPRPTPPRGVEVTVVDPGASEADGAVGRAVPGAASADAGRPPILTRRDWGADESKRGDGPFHGQAHIAFVHHTDGSNSYSPAQVPGIIRGIYDFHVNGQGWSDIGYNFLVDRFGRTWEGRYGGLDRAVIGAHTMNYNSWSFGVSAIGNFSSATPPADMVNAIERVIAWKFSIHGNPASGTVYARDKYFNRISGHRDGFSTACPGQALYNSLSAIRRDVAARMGTMRRVAVERSVDGDGTPDLLVYPGAVTPPALSGDPSMLRAASPQPVRSARTVGTGWGALDDIVLTPDFTGDGRSDVIARDPSTSSLRIYRGNGTGGWAGMTRNGAGWNTMTGLIASGDRDGDGRTDLLATRNDGALVLYTGDGRGWFDGSRVIGKGWQGLRSVTAVGDLTNDGHPDLLAIRSSDDTLLLYAGREDGSVASATVVSKGWGGIDTIVGTADLDGDGSVGDIVAREGTGRMRTYYADEDRPLARYNFWGAGWQTLDHVSSAADWDGDGSPDVLARVRRDGSLRLYSGTGARDFDRTPTPSQADGVGVDLMRIIGDVDGDGYSDVISRGTGGELSYLRGRADGTLGAPTPFGSGWDAFDLIEPLGDFSRDGVPDVMARTPGGQLRMYTLRRDFTWGWMVELGTGWQSMRSVTGAGSVNADFNGDVIALRDSDGAILNYRGSGPGTLNDAVVLLTGQDDLSRLLGVGDLNGDHANDLLAQDRSGDLWLYVGDGRNGFHSSRQPVRSAAPRTDVVG